MRIGLVTPWFGRDLLGGAERLAVDLADRLAERGHDVTVLTTCAPSWSAPWNRNVLAPGISRDRAIRVARFRVDHTNTGAFREINRAILATPHDACTAGLRVADEATEAAYVQHNINSTALLAELARNAADYDRILFLPYLYGTTLRGWHIPRTRSAIVPCLHDEPYAYLEPVAAMMRAAPLLLFNSVGEYELARRLYGPSIDRRAVVTGSAVDAPRTVTSRSPILGFVPETTPYVLFLGKNRDQKGLSLLLDAYQRFRALDPDSTLQLVIAGEGTEREQSPSVIALGRVSDDDKARLLASARALAQPSANESYSRVLVEAWSYGRPTVAHGDCLATALPMRETGAGWLATGVAEWQRVLHEIARADDAELSARGERAAAWIAQHASWSRVIDRFESALIDRSPSDSTGKRPVVHALGHAQYGDALTKAALRFDAALRERGRVSVVTARERDPRLGGLVRDTLDVAPDAVRIAYATGGLPPDLTGSDILVTAEAQLAQLMQAAHRARAVLALNEPTQRAFASAGIPATVLPPAFDDVAWNIAPDQAMLRALQGANLVLYAGTVDSSSGLLEIFETFENYLTFDFDARLAMVGPIVDPDYAEKLHRAIESVQLEHRVFLPGVVSTPALAAFYRSARIFVCNRSWLDTGEALVDALAFDLPVCATSNEYTQSLMRGCGVLVHPAPRIELAALWKVLISDPEVRATVIAGQRRRVAELSASASLDVLEAALGDA